MRHELAGGRQNECHGSACAFVLWMSSARAHEDDAPPRCVLARMWGTRGSAYASVLPLPVGAIATASRPLSKLAHSQACTGLSDVWPALALNSAKHAGRRSSVHASMGVSTGAVRKARVNACVEGLGSASGELSTRRLSSASALRCCFLRGFFAGASLSVVGIALVSMR